MSHFTVLNTRLTDREALVEALGDLGFRKVEVNDTPKKLKGWLGDNRIQTAEVIIRKKHVGFASNDIGFKMKPDGTYQALISDFDRPRFDKEWIEKLTQRHAYHLARRKLTEKGFDVVEESVERDGRIHITLRRVG